MAVTKSVCGLKPFTSACVFCYFLALRVIQAILLTKQLKLSFLTSFHPKTLYATSLFSPSNFQSKRVGAELNRLSSVYQSGTPPLLLDLQSATLSGGNIVYQVDSALLEQIIDGKALIDSGNFNPSGQPALKLMGSIRPSKVVSFDESLWLHAFFSDERTKLDDMALADYLVRSNRVIKIPVYFLFNQNIINILKEKIESASEDSKKRVKKQIARWEKRHVFSPPNIKMTEAIQATLNAQGINKIEILRGIIACVNEPNVDWQKIFSGRRICF